MFNESPFEILLITFINNIIFSLLTVFSISFLIDQLHAALVKENSLQEALIDKHKKVIIAMERVEKSDQLKSAFLANISHEIKTPMYGILGSAELLKSYEADNDDDFKEFITIIEQNGTKLVDVISGILNISEIETGVMTINRTTFDVNETLIQVYRMFLPDAELKGVTFTCFNTISESHKLVTSDRTKVIVILKNLIENAIKFTSKGDSIILKSAYDNEVLTFSLVDTGIGVPDDKVETIFNPFYQVDISNSNALHGSGIGLSIAQAYVKLLGGNLSLISEEGLGSTFLFSIATNLEEKHDEFG